MATIAAQARRAAPADATPDERAKLGKDARSEAPRKGHGDWEPAADRPDPVDVLEGQAKTRVPELVPLRYARMLVSPFTFYRGAAAVMAADLAATPTSGFWAQLCGDAHLSNFGGFAAPDRELVLDVNDFDETLPGPWEWDVKRLAASLEIAARDRGFDRRQRETVVLAGAEEYRQRMRDLAGLSNLDVWYMRLDMSRLMDRFSDQLTKKRRQTIDRTVAKAESKNRMKALSRLAERVDGKLRLISDPPLIVPIEDVAASQGTELDEVDLKAVIDTYRRTLEGARRRLFDSYRYVHTARKVVGVGSVGTRAWVALFVGRDDDDPLFLQIKEAEESVLAPYAAPSAFAQHGRRVVEGQRLMQAASDIMLGWMSADQPDGRRLFYVRQLWDAKVSARIETMDSGRLAAYARICGAILARAHARTADRIAIASYLGAGDKFDQAIARFAAAYADQNERDYAALREAADGGRIAVAEGA
jgi:uncharacterized protein (DUF2252 family)